LKITSNVLVTLVRAEQDCFKELFEAVDITRRIKKNQRVRKATNSEVVQKQSQH